MSIGGRRKAIMDTCPEEFKDSLKDFIDDIESRINAIMDNMTVDSLQDMHRITDGFDELSVFVGELY